LNKFIAVKDGKLNISTEGQWDFLLKTCLLGQQSQDLYKNVKDALKASYLVVKYTNLRTQFKTLEEKGKERKIFEYNFNKSRIMKAVLESLSIYLNVMSLMQNIKHNMGKPVKNQERLKDLSIFIDAYEVYVNEKLAENIETLRESTGGMGYLKFSGIPNLLENAIRNASLTSSDKTQRYMKLASYIVNQDMKNKSDFLKYFFPHLVDQMLRLPSSAKLTDFKRIDLLAALGASKILWRREMIIKDGLLSTKRDTIGRSLEEPLQLAIDVMENMTANAGYREIFQKSNRANGTLLGTLTVVGSLNQLQSDARFLLSKQEIFEGNFSEGMKQTVANAYDGIAKIAIELVDSFLFDEKMLGSCFRKTAEETYEQVFDWSKNHNLRNKPELHEEIRKELVAYINRPETKL